MGDLIWLHDDCLNPEHIMFRDYADARRVYVFDVGYLQGWQVSKHRVQFIYECLLEIPGIEIYKGEMVGVLRELLDKYKVDKVVSAETPNHIIKGWQRELEVYTNLLIYPDFYPVKDTSSPRRFSGYWKKHQESWLNP